MAGRFQEAGIILVMITADIFIITNAASLSSNIEKKI
jgi:hypothetical protein